MGAKTSIAWCDSTWNPIRGCLRVSEGCRRCYAEGVAARFSDEGMPYHGYAARTPAGPRWTGRVELVEKHLSDPLRWQKPRRVFVNSMSDLFHEALPDEAIDRVFAVMALAARHTFQCLTKRPERMLRYFQSTVSRWTDARGVSVPGERKDDAISGYEMFEGKGRCSDSELLAYQDSWPLPNVWLGVSVEDQATADERIPLLLQTPAAVRFVSYEPALERVDFRDWLCPKFNACQMGATAREDIIALVKSAARREGWCGVDWVICGGESGHRARAFDLAWARSAVKQCRAAAVPVFIKQLGAFAYDSFCQAGATDQRIYLKDRKGGDIDEFPEGLNVREFPEVRA